MTANYIIISLTFLASCQLMNRNSQHQPIDGISFESKLDCLDSTYVNELLFPDLVGKMYLFNEVDSSVFILWEDRRVSLGKIKNNHPEGKWINFDKRSRVESIVLFGNEGRMILGKSMFNKKGEMIYQRSASVPF